MAHRPVAELVQAEGIGEGGSAYWARIDHSGADNWQDVRPIHHGAFTESGTPCLPPLAGIFDSRFVSRKTKIPAGR
ncbi:protein of unknown function [Burkholderia multivorans]